MLRQPPHPAYSALHERLFFYACLALSALVLAPLWRPLAAGLVLGYFSEDAVAALCTRLRLGPRTRPLAAAGFITGVLILFLLPVGFAIYQALHELLSSFDGERLAKSGAAIGPLSELSHTVHTWLVARLSAWGLPLSASLVSALGDRLRESALPLLQSALGGLRSMAAATPRAVLYTVIAVVTWWLSALEGPRLRSQALPWILPWAPPREILGRAIRAVLRGLIVANLAVAAVQAVLCTLGLLLTGIPRAVSLGVLTFFLAFVPVVGTGLVTVGAALYLFSQGRVGAGLAMLGLAVVAGTIDNLLRPFFLRGQVELPIAWIFLSIMGGLVSLGLFGLLLGPVIAYACREAFLVLLRAEVEPPASAVETTGPDRTATT